MEYLWVSLRLIYAFFLVLVFFQISGNKRQFSQMTTFDLISNFILSAILSGYIISGKAGCKGFSVVIAVYFSINYLINLIGHTNWGRRLIIGTPTILIDKGKINRRNLQKMNMNMTDFLSLLRTKDIHSLQDVSLAQIEIGGNLTVLRKGEEAFSVLLIENGVINHENLRQIQKTESWLRRKLKEMKVNKAEEVFYAQWQKGKLYVIKN